MAVFREWSMDNDRLCDNNNSEHQELENVVDEKCLRDQIQAIKCRLTERLPLDNHATLT